MENYGKNNNENLTWYERWYESESELKASKFGRNLTDEWQESWDEKFTDKSRLQPIYKSCVKKGRKLGSCVEWYEEWMERFGLNIKGNLIQLIYILSLYLTTLI